MDDARFRKYRRKSVSELRPYEPGEALEGVSVSAVDTPKIGGMIARNPDNHQDQWYVAEEYFLANLEPIEN